MSLDHEPVLEEGQHGLVDSVLTDVALHLNLLLCRLGPDENGHLREVDGLECLGPCLPLDAAHGLERAVKDKADVFLGENWSVDQSCVPNVVRADLTEVNDVAACRKDLVQGLLRCLGHAPRQHIRQLLLDELFEIPEHDLYRFGEVAGASQRDIVVLEKDLHLREVDLEAATFAREVQLEVNLAVPDLERT